MWVHTAERRRSARANPIARTACGRKGSNNRLAIAFESGPQRDRRVLRRRSGRLALIRRHRVRRILHWAVAARLAIGDDQVDGRSGWSALLSERPGRWRSCVLLAALGPTIRSLRYSQGPDWTFRVVLTRLKKLVTAIVETSAEIARSSNGSAASAQRLQSAGEDVGGDALFGVLEQLAEVPSIAEHDIAEDEQRPRIPERLEAGVDRTSRSRVVAHLWFM